MGKSAATENRFVSIKGFKENNVGNKVQLNTKTLMLDMPNQSAHSLATLINNQALHEVFSRTEGNYLHRVVKVEPSVLSASDVLLAEFPNRLFLNIHSVIQIGLDILHKKFHVF